MSLRKLLYEDNGNVQRVLHFDDRGGFEDTFHIETIEDHTDVLEGNKRLRENQTAKSDMKHVARIPVTVFEKALREGWAHDDAAWKRWLNDPANKGFRVWEGQV